LAPGGWRSNDWRIEDQFSVLVVLHHAPQG
jgi:hypothetical protein